MEGSQDLLGALQGLHVIGERYFAAKAEVRECRARTRALSSASQSSGTAGRGPHASDGLVSSQIGRVVEQQAVLRKARREVEGQVDGESVWVPLLSGVHLRLPRQQAARVLAAGGFALAGGPHYLLLLPLLDHLHRPACLAGCAEAKQLEERLQAQFAEQRRAAVELEAAGVGPQDFA